MCSWTILKAYHGRCAKLQSTNDSRNFAGAGAVSLLGLDPEEPINKINKINNQEKRRNFKVSVQG